MPPYKVNSEVKVKLVAGALASPDARAAVGRTLAYMMSHGGHPSHVPRHVVYPFEFPRRRLGTRLAVASWKGYAGV